MLIEGTKSIAAPRDAVWRSLHDPAFLQRVIPGCRSVRAQGTDALDVSLAAAVGPIRAGFDMRVQIANVVAPASYELRGSGSAGAAGSGSGTVRVELEDIENGTLLRYAATTELHGRIAQLGARMVDAAARRFSEEFFTNVARALAPAEVAGGDAGAQSASRGVNDGDVPSGTQGVAHGGHADRVPAARGAASGAHAPVATRRDELARVMSQLAWKLFAACCGGTFAGAMAAWTVLH